MLKSKLKELHRNKKCGFALLLDPDKLLNRNLEDIIKKSCEMNIDCFLIGSSILLNSNFDAFVSQIKKYSSEIPVYIFPGNGLQVSDKADGILFTSLISGRNPDFLINQQVLAAPSIAMSGIETLATAYILIESGLTTSVEFMSNTKPIPREKTDIAVAHALASKFLGFEAIYLEAGSGATNTVPDNMISKISNSCKMPIIVGGGIKSEKHVSEKVKAGANLIVCGNFFEDNQYDFDKMQLMVTACKE